MERSAIVVEDDANTALALTKAISSMGFTVRVAGTLEEAQRLYRENCPDIVLLDVTLPDGDGLELMQENAGKHSTRFVIITGDSRQEVAVRSLRAHAADFLVKPVTMADLRGAVEKSALTHAANDDSDAFRSQVMVNTLATVKPMDTLDRSDTLMTGTSFRVRQLDQAIQQLAEINTNVVITGEAGVDKIAAAFALHRRTPRHDVIAVVQCATGNVSVGSKTVTNGFSECLGMAFSHSKNHKRVTLVLNDVEQLSEARQRELLSYLTTHSLMDLQVSTRPRIVSIIRSCSPSDAVECHSEPASLIPDLQLCLDQSQLEIPALRQRREDIVPIAQKHLDLWNAQKKTRRILSDDSVEAIERYPWPGNVRELTNILLRTFNTTDYMLEIGDLLSPDSDDKAMHRSVEGIVGKTFWEVEKSLLRATLQANDGDKKLTAQTLGISLKTLYNRMNAYNIDYKSL